MRSIAVLLVLLIAGCGTSPDDPVTDDGPPPASAGSGTDELILTIVVGDPGTEPGITVAEARTHGPTDDIVAVTGALFIDPDGTVRLCDAIAESFPPQCGGERIIVEGLDPTAVAGLQTEGDVSWAEAVTLLGSVE